MGRRGLVVLLCVLAVGLGLVLWGSVREGRQFNLPLDGAELEKQLPVGPTLAAAAAMSATTVLDAPRYTGRSADGTTYTLSASRADQAGSVSASVLVLHNLTAQYVGAGGDTPLAATATSGEYAQSDDTLGLRGAELRSDGLRMTTPSATLNLRDRTVVGEDLMLEGPLGGATAVLRGETFTLDQASGRVRVVGNVNVRLP